MDAGWEVDEAIPRAWIQGDAAVQTLDEAAEWFMRGGDAGVYFLQYSEFGSMVAKHHYVFCESYEWCEAFLEENSE